MKWSEKITFGEKNVFLCVVETWHFVGCGFGEQRGWEYRKLGVSAYLHFWGARPSGQLDNQLGIHFCKVRQDMSDRSDLFMVYYQMNKF